MVRRWDRWKNPWDREYAKRGRLWRGRATIDPLPELVPPPSRVLDVGCGDGKFAQALTTAGYEWVGIDFSRHALRILNEPGRSVLGDALRMPFVDGSFSVVVARYTLGALRACDRDHAAAELMRVRAQGGFVLVEEFLTSDYRFGKGTPVEDATFERNQGLLTHYFLENELRMLLPGLRVVGCDVIRRSLRVLGRAHDRVSLRVVYGDLTPERGQGRRDA